MMKKQVTVVFVTAWMFTIMHTSLYATTSLKPNNQDDTQQYGTVSGRVVNDERQPVAEAEVSAEQVGVIDRFPVTAKTDGDGRFTIKLVAGKTYKLYSAKKEDGYDSSRSGDSPNVTGYADNLPQVIVSEGQVIEDVSVPIGPKKGRLIVRVVDVETNKPIGDARVAFRHIDGSEVYRSSGMGRLRRIRGELERVDGEVEFLTPPVPFTVEVTAPGYEKWRYKADALQLSPSESKELVVTLKKSSR